jgi:hypothetical protein
VTAPDCCEKERPAPRRTAPESLAAPEFASAPAARPVAGLAAEALTLARPEAIDRARAGLLHDLGLFTLHSVFRI